MIMIIMMTYQRKIYGYRFGKLNLCTKRRFGCVSLLLYYKIETRFRIRCYVNSVNRGERVEAMEINSLVL